MRDVLSLIGEILFLLVALPLIFIGAIFIGILYFLFIIKEFIKTIIFNK